MARRFGAVRPAKARFSALAVRASLALVLVAAGVRMDAAPRPARYAEFDKKILAEIQARNPEAAALFVQANEARDRGDYKAAADLYLRVRQLDPSFFHATRRLCGVYSALGDRGTAVRLCRDALAAEKTPENLSALALALISESKVSEPLEADWNEALELAREAIGLDPNSEIAVQVFAQIALHRKNFSDLKNATARLEQIAPDEISTQLLRAVVAASEGDSSEASRAIDRAGELGLSPDAVREFREKVRSARPWPLRILPTAAIVLGAWAAAFLLLFLAGLLLSRAALRAAGELPSDTTGRAHGVNRKVLRLYSRILRLCCFFYYASIPILLVTIVGLGGGAIYGFFALGHVPVKLMVMIALVMVTSLASILKSLLARRKDADPGLPLDLSEHPRLRAALDEVAGRVGTRPVDRVYLVPDTTVAVLERGSMFKQLGGHPERCLVLGAGALEGMRLRPFKAILAHEYGHFSNRDTDPGSLSLAVTHSLSQMAVGLARGGAATWWNPAWLFVNGFHRVFLRISHGASRLQEVLADRWAAFNYGSASFVEGLTHIVARGVRLGAQVTATVREAVKTRTPVSNFYSHRPGTSEPEEGLEAEIRQSLERQPSPYDTHPAPVQRFEWVRALDAPGAAVSPDDDADAWILLSDRSRIELQMSEVIRTNLANFHGVALPNPEPSPAT